MNILLDQRTGRKSLKYVHLLAITFIIIGLIVIYLNWPWSGWPSWFGGFALYFEYKFFVIGSLFAIPFVYATLVYQWKGAFTVWFISFATLLPIVIHVYSPQGTLRSVITLLVPLTLAAIIILEIKLRERDRRLLEKREAERQAYLAEIFKARENERQRIGQELHDDCLQTLMAIASHTKNPRFSNQESNTAVDGKGTDWVAETIMDVCEDLRRLSLDLRPSVLDNIGLVKAIIGLADTLEKRNSIHTIVNTLGEERKIPPEIELAVFRIIQEALNNVRRHSSASAVNVTLEFTQDSIKAVVHDNGHGFSLGKNYIRKLASEGKLGLIGMQQRAKLINGNLNIESQPQFGTTVTFVLADK